MNTDKEILIPRVLPPKIWLSPNITDSRIQEEAEAQQAEWGRQIRKYADDFKL